MSFFFSFFHFCLYLSTAKLLHTPSFTYTTTMTDFKASATSRVGYTINNKYHLVKILGYGASGTVYLATNIDTQENFAIKLVAKPNDEPFNFSQSPEKHIQATPVSLSRQEIQSNPNHPVHIIPPLYKEVLLHSFVHAHPNIISVIEVLDAPSHVCVVLEYCEIGDLFCAITERNWYVGNEALAKDLFLQLLDAVEFCHNRSVFHCDLKPENILIGGAGTTLKIADFGLSSQSPLCSVFGRGSSYYMAPETIAENVCYRKREPEHQRASIQRRSSDETMTSTIPVAPKRRLLQSMGFPRASSDVWALGIIFINLIFGRNPWKKASLVEDAAYRDYSQNPNTLKSILPASDELCNLLAHVFHPDPYRRISISRLREEVINIPNLATTGSDFPWFKTIQPKAPVVVSRPVPVKVLAVQNSPPTSSTRVTSNNRVQKSTSRIVSDVTYVHIENRKTSSVSNFSQPKVINVLSCQGKRCDPIAITPPVTNVSSASTDVSCSPPLAITTSQQAQRKRKVFNKWVDHLYPVTPEKSLISSASVTNTKVMFHPNSHSLYFCNSSNNKRIRSTSLLQQ